MAFMLMHAISARGAGPCSRAAGAGSLGAMWLLGAGRVGGRRIPRLAAGFLLAGVVLAGCGGGSADEDSAEGGSARTTLLGERAEQIDEEVAARADSYDEAPTKRLDPDQRYVVRMETTKGTFDIRIDQEAGPIAAANFVFLVEEGYYDGLRFHRVLDGYVVQAGDPLGVGAGGPGYAIEDDPVDDPYVRGVVAMANRGPGTGGSQFFIVQGRRVELPPDYAIFGRVDPRGMRVVDRIAAVAVEPAADGEPSSPVEPVRIVEATLVSA